jgi:hypothetical protein
MAIVDFSRLIDFKTWFERTNDLGNAVGDTDNLNYELGSNLVNAANEVLDDLGDVTTLNTVTPVTNLVDGMNDVSNEIGRFRISEGEPQAYDMHPIHVFGSETDFDAHGFFE